MRATRPSPYFCTPEPVADVLADSRYGHDVLPNWQSAEVIDASLANIAYLMCKVPTFEGACNSVRSLASFALSWPK